MSFFRNMNRKTRREFSKMNNEQKETIISEELNGKIKDAVSAKIANSFINGVITANHLLYEKYVEKIENSENQEEIAKLMIALIDEIKSNNDKYNQKFNAKVEEKDASN